MKVVLGCLYLLPFFTSSLLISSATAAPRLLPSQYPQDVPGFMGRYEAPATWLYPPSPLHPIVWDAPDANQDAEAHQAEGDAYQNVGGTLLPYPAYPCWYHLEPVPCPSRLFQVLVDHLAGASRLPQLQSWTPTSTQGLPSNLQWLRRPPSKRYLGIELPDYIATSYSSIKTDNAQYLTKLHQLKQRMRNAGK